MMTAGCSQDNIADDVGGGDGVKSTSYVTLSLAMPSSTGTRATGGENGDDNETGQPYENTISSAVAFFYQGTGVNDADNTKIDAAVSFTFGENDGTDGTKPIDRVYTTQPQEVDLENGTYHVIVVANPGTDWWTGDKLTLHDVRDHNQKQAWMEDNGTYSNFLMSLADERDGSAVIELNSNPQDNPAETTVYVERMAARVDYKDGRQELTCDDPTYDGATVEIVGAALVNNLIEGSFLLKRVADDVYEKGLKYLGDETEGNYVLDPWTSAEKPENYFGTPYVGRSQDPSWWNKYVQEGTPLQGESTGWNLVGYTLENCPAAPSHNINTAVVFKAKFTPVGLPSYWTKGETFFAYGTNLFATMEDMMTWMYGADEFADFDNKVTGCTTWNELQSFVTTSLGVSTSDPSGYEAYLNDQLNKVENISAEIPQGVKPTLTWNYYMLHECGYSMSGEGHDVKIDQYGKVTREVLNRYGVRTYVNSMSYYTWWIRHNDDENPDAIGPMEYAVVRNNIYKLNVTSVYSLGGDIPGEDNGLELVVYVNDWRLLETENIDM